MKRLFCLLPILFFIKVSAQGPYYDFNKSRENYLLKDSLKKHLGKTQPLSRIMGRIVYSQPNGTFILSLDKNIPLDSLQPIIETLQKLSEKQHRGRWFILNQMVQEYMLCHRIKCLVLYRICHNSICL